MLFRLLILISVLILAGLVAGAWLTLGDTNNGQSAVLNKAERSFASKDWQAQLSRLAARTGDSASRSWPFAALKGNAELMPKIMRRAAIASLGGHQRLGLRFDRAQYVSTSTDVGIWVVRGTGVTCIFQDRKAAAGCATDANASRQGLALVVGYGRPSSNAKLPARFLTFGIAPNSVKAVRLKAIGGGSTTVPIVENAYGLRTRAPIEVEKLIRR
jgi:hypothetical protein